ncbi:MAG: serine hydrolase domain-containing protein [Bacteroidia bacterium]|nr:serine hydrolase domain-containing protein [Bacteroidia bacterium]
MKQRILISAALLLVCAGTLLAQTPLTPAQTRLIDSLVRRDVPPQAPGVAFGVVKNGRILYTQYAGFAQLENALPIGPDTRFNIASNGKQFTALAILSLMDDGNIRLHDDIRQFFPGLYPHIRDSITLAHLLTHTSGIRDVYDLLALQGNTWWKMTLANADVLDLLGRQQTLNFAPGSAYLYSNSNYILLAEIVARVSGKSFVEYTNDLFRRMGMPDTRFEADFSRIQGPVAKPYFNFNTWTTYDWIWNVVGDGNLFTTLPDQLRFEQLVQSGKVPGLRKKAVAASQQRIISETAYGYGLEFSIYRGQEITFHHGGTGAWKATLLRFPEKQLSLITFSNSGKTDVVDQNQRIADILLGADPAAGPDYPIVPEPGGEVVAEEEITGVYLDEQGTVFRFLKKEDGLYLIRTGRNDVRLERESGNVFRQVYDPAFKQSFVKNPEGEWTITAWYPTHAPYTLARLEADFSGFVPEKLNGSFKNTETGARITLKYLGDQQFEYITGGQQGTGLLLTPRMMLADGYTLRFSGPDGFFLSGGRIMQVGFERAKGE